MQIHELPVGSPASGVQFAGDTGAQTPKIDYDALADAILNKLTTKTFDIKSESQTIIAALNALGDASKQDVANNLVTTAAGLVLDARQGKALNDSIASLNSSPLTIAPGDNVTIVNNNSVKNDKMVVINTYFQCASITQGIAFTAGTLPVGARPANETVIIAFDASTYDFCGGWLTSTGLIRVAPKNTATNRQIRVCCAFLAS